MPSIPQSLLWISLVVLWLFVLVPMLISKRDAVRRTSDVALATRVLNGGVASRLLKRGGPAAGHRSDPHWKPDEGAAEDQDQYHDTHEGEREDDTDDLQAARPVVMQVAAPEITEPDYLDVDVVEDSEALPVGASAEASDSGAEGVDEDEDSREFIAPGGSRRRRFDTKTAAEVSARKYTFRKRVLMLMAVFLVGSATTAFEVSRTAWWVCGSATAFTLLYLVYLRRQTRIEERVRRRRMQRMARARLGVENTYDREYDVVPSRLRRPGAVVLEIDDEDPIFEHLDNAMPMRTFGWPRDLPRAVGE